MTSRRPSILNRSSTQTQTELPTQEDQIRGYRRMARNRHQVARTTRRVFGRNNYNRTLETAVDTERQLEISRERRANLVPAEVLYSNNRSTARHRVYEHYSEQRILCVGENQINLRLCIEKERLEEQKDEEIRELKAQLQKKKEEAKVHLSREEFPPLGNTHIARPCIEIGVHYSGNATTNARRACIIFLGICHGVFPRICQMPEHITTTGITTIPGERRSIKELEGMSWHLKPPEQTLVRVPSRVAVNERLTRSQLVGEMNSVTPGKVTILEERSDWDDDERSGGKVLVIQERLAQNQQEFLDEYLPQWDENLAIQKRESESEWENPFAAKRAQIIKKHKEHAFPSSSSQIESTQSYQPPHDSIMGPPVYPPVQQNPQPFYRPDYQFGYPQGKSKIFNGGYGEYYNSQWTLPPAWTESGVMLVLPADPGLWSKVISSGFTLCFSL
ncbi:hypothetical protein Tco_1284082 [Tanacetum coccineum]